MTITEYVQDLKDVGVFVWDVLSSLEILVLVLFIFFGYLLFGIVLFHKKRKPRSWRGELLLIAISLICVERWFWIAQGERLLSEGATMRIVIEQNAWLLISALVWYFGLFATRHKNTYVKVLTVIVGLIGLYFLLLVNLFYFVGTP